MTVDDVKVHSDEESAASPLPEPSTELLFGAGQSAWLGVITVGVILALAVSFVALFMALDAKDDAGGVTVTPTGPATELSVEAVEFGFDPARATIVADADVAVTVQNTGLVQHNWTVLSSSIADESEFDEGLVLATLSADPGSSESAAVNLPAGSYQVICTIAGHFSAGMEATLEVTA